MIKKTTIFISLLLFYVFNATAQIENPVKWSFSAKKLADKSYELHIAANLDKNWHIYAQDAGEGPVPTSFSFTPNPLVKLDGKVKEAGKLEKSYDPNFKSVLKYYSSGVDFVQKIKIKSKAATLVNGTVTYMVCNDKKCLSPTDVPFSIKVNAK
jgi:DsbC/DsbD-like thiol-disulfide interchange protein